MSPDHLPIHLPGKLYDVLATLTAGGTIAVALSDIDLFIKIVVGVLTIVFLVLGIILRGRAVFGKKRKTNDESKTDSD